MRVLLEGVQAGNEGARAELVERLGPLVWALCRRLDQQPEDAYQDAWAHLFAVIGRFEPHGTASLRTWVKRVVHRRLVDRHRRSKVRAVVSPWESGMVEERVASGLPGPEQLASEGRRRARLEAALEHLAPAQRRVVVLHHIHGTPLDELAEREGVALGTIKSRLHRGRARLLQLLETP